MKWWQKTVYLRCHQPSLNRGCLECCIDREYESHMVGGKVTRSTKDAHHGGSGVEQKHIGFACPFLG